MRTNLDIQHSGTLGTEGRTAMTFDENSIAHLMTVLTDLYSNKTLAVIREYSTNAADAHKAAGNPDPIEITLPNPMSPIFKVIDHGTGMTVDEVNDHFSKYGWSSKRDNDDEAGMLGLGCKAGLTYTSQFTMVTVKNGVKATVLVTREESGGGVVQIIDTVATTERNGTEIQIPVKNVQLFLGEAEEFFYYWDEGTVLVDGAPPVRCIWTEQAFLRLDEDVIVRPTGTGHKLVMGGIAYPINPANLFPDMQGQYHRRTGPQQIIARVPIGSVNFTPSREALQYTKRTNETLRELEEFVHGGMHRTAQAAINGSPTHKDAWRLYQEWHEIVQRYTPVGRRGGHLKAYELTYKGQSFPITFQTDPQRTLEMNIRVPYHSSDPDRSTRHSHVKMRDLMETALLVQGHMGTALAAGTKARIRKYAKETLGLDAGRVLVYPRHVAGSWDGDIPKVDFNTIRAIELPKTEREKAVTEKFKYRIQNGHDRYDQENVNELPATCVTWLPAADSRVNRQNAYNFCGRGVLAIVNAADEKRFTRDHPNVMPFEIWVKLEILGMFQNMDPWMAYDMKDRYDSRPYGAMRKFPSFLSWDTKWGDKVLDHDVRDLVREYDVYERSTGHRRIDAASTLAGEMGFEMPPYPETDIGKRLKKVVKRYGVLVSQNFNTSDMEGIVQAMNAIHIVENSLHVIPVY